MWGVSRKYSAAKIVTSTSWTHEAIQLVTFSPGHAYIELKRCRSFDNDYLDKERDFAMTWFALVLVYVSLNLAVALYGVYRSPAFTFADRPLWYVFMTAVFELPIWVVFGVIKAAQALKARISR